MRRLRVWLTTLLALVAMLAIGVGLLHSGPVRSLVLQAVSAWLHTQGIEFSAGSLDYNLLTLTVWLKDVMAGASGAHTPFLSVRSAMLRIDARPLLRKKLVVHAARIEEPRLELAVDASGKINLPALATTEVRPAAGGEWPFVIEALDVTAGAFNYADAGRGISVSLPAWTAAVRGDVQTLNHRIRILTVAPGEMRLAERVIPIDRLEFVAEAGSKAAEVQMARLESAGSFVQLAGKVSDFSAPFVDARVRAGVDVAGAAALAGLSGLEGALVIDATVEGRLDNLSAAAGISGRKLRFRQFRDAKLSGQISFASATKQLRVESLRLSSPLGSIRATGVMGIDSVVPGRLSASIERLDLERVAAGFGLAVRPAAVLSGKVEAHWKGSQLYAGRGSATFEITPSARASSPGALAAAGNLRAAWKDREIQVELLGFKAAGLEVEGTVGMAGGQDLNGELRLRAGSLVETANDLRVSKALPETIPYVELDGSLAATLSLGGTLSRPEIAVAAEAPSLNVSGFEGIGLSVRGVYTPERIKLDLVDLSWRGQSLRAGGMIGLDSPSPSLELEVHLEGASLGALAGGFGGSPVDGSVDLAAVARGSLESPDVSLAASVSSLRAFEEDFGTLNVAARLAGKTVEIERIVLAKPAPGEPGRLEGQATIGLADKTFRFQSAGTLKLENLKLPGERTVRTGVSFEAAGQGSFDNPALRLSLEATDLKLGDLELGNIHVEGGVVYHAARLEAGVDNFGLAAVVEASTSPPYPASFRLTAQKTDLSKFGVAGLEGTVSLKAEGAGELDHLEQGRALVRLEDLEARFKELRLLATTPLEIRYRDEKVEISSARLVSGRSELTVGGVLPVKAPADGASVEVQGRVDLSDLLALAPALEGLQAEGALELRAEVGGSFKAPDPQAQLVLEGASLKHPRLRAPLSGIGLEVTYSGGAVELVSFRANLGGGKIEAGGRLPLGALGFDLPLKIPADGSPAVFRAALRELRPQEIFELPEQVSGIFSLNVQAEMERLAELNTLRADISFPRLELAGAGIELRQTETALLTIRQGRLQVERFQVAGTGSRIEIAGSAALEGSQALDLGIRGDLDAGLLALLVRGLRARGPANFAVAIAGSPVAPQLHGYLELSQGSLAVSSPQIGVDELDVRVDFSPGQAEITRFTGTLNGGALTGGGRVRMEGATFKEIRAEASVKGAYLEFPPGLRSRLDARLNISTQDEFVLVGGEVHILESSYRRDIDVAGGLDYFRSSSAPTLPEERNPWLSRVRFDMAVDTQGPLLIDNNLARLTLTAGLRLVGTYYRPGLTGRASIEEGGNLFLNERTYLIERGIVSFNNESKIEPELDILATTEVRPYQISLQLSGTLADLKTELSSDPPLAEPDILSVLVTGRPLSELEGSGLAVAREQAGALLSSQAAGLVSRRARETLRLSQVRIDPSFINPEANPGARLTIGQELSNRLQLIYSMNLVNGGEQIYIVRYDVTRRFQTEATRQSDESYRFDLRHDLRFGGYGPGRPAARQARQRIGRISISGVTVFEPARIASKLGVEPGDVYNFFELQKGIDRLLRFYDEAGYPEAAIRTMRSEREKLVDITIEVKAGPKVQFIYEGFDVPRSLARNVRRLWRQGQFDAQRTEDAVREIRTYLGRRGYLESEIQPEIKMADSGEKRVIFQIQPGPRYRSVEVHFTGLEANRSRELRRLLEKSGQIEQLVLAPGAVADFLVGYCRRQGYLDVRVGSVRRELDAAAGRAKFTIELEEGPIFRVAAIHFEGNRALDEAALRESVLLRESEPYRPELVQRSIERLEELYWACGYNDVVILPSLERAARPGEVALAFRITENRQEIVQSVAIEGNRAVSEKLIRSQLALAEGDVLDYAKTSRSRRSLYQTGAFTLVDLAREPLEGPEPPWATGRKRVNLRVRVQEVEPFRLRYGFFFDTERGAGGIAEFTNRNSLGAARLLGLRTRYDADVREFRAYFSQPLLRSFPVQTNITGFARREIQQTFITDRVGFSAQQEAHLGGKFILSYGYRLERTHTFDKDPESPFQLLPFRIAPLVATLTRETRDDVLDARRGSFLSQAFEWAPAAFGSELHYLKYFGQYFRYVPLSRPAEFAFGQGARRARWVYAGAVRVGLAGGLGGQELIRSERFFAGGGTTLRGFDQNTLGPVDFLGDPAGGNAMFLLNQELRFPLLRILEGVGFLDIGNVYAGVRDFDLFNVRKSAGAGLRIRTPYFLLRVDYGRKLDRRPGEPAGKFFFSIGQAF